MTPGGSQTWFGRAAVALLLLWTSGAAGLRMSPRLHGSGATGLRLPSTSLHAEGGATSALPASLHEPVCIIGAGPSGLATAIMLARRGYKQVRVFERLSEPLPPDSPEWVDFTRERSYNIGLSGRGQKALREIAVMPAVEKFCADVIGRKDWSPESKEDAPQERVYTTKSYTTKVIQRDRLAAALLSELRSNPEYAEAVTVKFNTQCQRVDLTRDSAFVHLTDKASVGELVLESKFVIGADGTASALRDAMEAASGPNKLTVTRYEDKNVRVYRTIPLHFPPGDTKTWNSKLNFSARTKSDINLDALPTLNGPMLAVVLYRPWDTRVTGLKGKEDAKAFFQSTLPMFSSVLRDDDLERFAKKECSKLPRFSFTGPRLHHGNTACLLGDAIHTVKPYFGLGVNSAFEDVLALDAALGKHSDDVPKALKDYSRTRAAEARAMVQISHRLDGGFLSFVLPLLVDNFFHAKLPQVFAPNMLAILQNEKLSFSFIQFRKRLDRVMQVSVVGALAVAATKTAGLVFRLGRRLVLAA